MTEVHTMRDLEYLEEQNRQLRESLKACKLDVNKLRADQREADEEFILLQNDLGQALIELENLRAAVEEIYKSSHQVHIIEIARAALEGK